MGSLKERTYLESTLGKIIAGVVIGSIALLVYWSSTNFAFNQILGTVEKISEPNQKLAMVNQLFRDIIKLDQQQRKLAAEKPDDKRIYNLQNSEHIYKTIDTLKLLLDENSLQALRLDTMINLLEERDRVFLNYISLRSDLMTNKSLSSQVQSLARLLSESRSNGQTSTSTRQGRVTRTTTIIPSDTITVQKEPENESVLRRFFGSRRASEIEMVTTPTTIVEEEIDFIADTISPGINDSLAIVIEQRIRNIERRQQVQSTRLLESELEFLIVSDYLISELLSILKAIEADELAVSEQDKIAAFNLVNEALDRSTLLLLILIAGAFILLFFTAVDITKSRRYRRQLSEAKNAAENLSMVKQRFLANMSHEIRTPLQSILGFSEQLQKRPANDTDAFNAIHKSALYLLQIVNEILDYSRIISGKFKFDDKPFELRQHLTDIAAVMSVQAKKKGLDFKFETNITEAASVSGDAFRLQQILYNLLSNAIKYTQEGSILMMVVATKEAEYVHLEILVEDSGIGIDKNDLKRIFNEFGQADTNTSKNTSGTGLGLSIVKALVEAQNGIVAADSIVGVGTSFLVRLRYKHAHLNEIASADAVVKSSGNLAGVKILIIDDDLLIIKLCSMILHKTGAELFTYHQHAETEQELPNDYMPQIVLTDIRMAGRNGFEWLKKLRATFGNGLPVIAISAQALPEEIEALNKAGFNSHLMKPIVEDQLLNELERFLSPTKPSVFSIPASNGAKITNGQIFSDLDAEIAGQFVKETSMDLEKLNRALEDSNKEAVIHQIHRLAGRTGQLGLKSTYIKLRKAEVGLLRGASVSDFAEDLNQTQDELRIIIKKFAEAAHTTGA